MAHPPELSKTIQNDKNLSPLRKNIRVRPLSGLLPDHVTDILAEGIEHVKLTDATKAYLKENYSDCLCKDCLEKLNQQ